MAGAFEPRGLTDRRARSLRLRQRWIDPRSGISQCLGLCGPPRTKQSRREARALSLIDWLEVLSVIRYDVALSL